MKFTVMVITTVLAVFSIAYAATAQPPLANDQQVGRYQIAAGADGWIFVLDTATGQCWSKHLSGQWRDEGNPARLNKTEARDKANSPLTLVLPHDKVELAIKQRQSKPIPGSHDRVIVRLDDITGGQVLISMRSDDGKVLLDDVSAVEGDIFPFVVGNQTFYCRVKALKNFVVGQDIAVLEIASDLKTLQAKEKTDGSGDAGSDERG